MEILRNYLLFILLTVCLTTFGQTQDELLYEAVTMNEVEQARTLINNGANSNYVKSIGPWMKVNLLITATNNKNLEMSKLLLENKVDVNWKDGFKTSAILYAANSGIIEMVELLLKHGANINDSDWQGNTVLTAAKESGNKEMASFVKNKLKEK